MAELLDELEDVKRQLAAALGCLRDVAEWHDGWGRPDWDGRKTLSDVWQDHAPLPAEGLTDRVYEALIAVACAGYDTLTPAIDAVREHIAPHPVIVIDPGRTT